MNRSTFNKAVVPGLFAFMIDGFKKWQSKQDWEAIVDVRTSKRAYEEAAYAGGLGLFAHKPEGEAISYDDFTQGPTQKWVHKTYSLGVKITEEMIEDSLYPDIPTEMRSFTEELGRSAAETKAIIVWDLLNNYSNYSCADDVALFSASHKYINNSLWSNLLSPAADLSATSLQTALDGLESIKDESGRYQIIKATSLLVNPSSAWKAKELLNSTYDPESANNAVNTLKDKNLKLIVSPYFTDTDAFCLIATPANRMSGLIAFNRRAVTFAKDGDFDTGDSKFKGSFRFSVGAAKLDNMSLSAGA